MKPHLCVPYEIHYKLPTYTHTKCIFLSSCTQYISFFCYTPIEYLYIMQIKAYPANVENMVSF